MNTKEMSTKPANKFWSRLLREDQIAGTWKLRQAYDKLRQELTCIAWSKVRASYIALDKDKAAKASIRSSSNFSSKDSNNSWWNNEKKKVNPFAYILEHLN